ncbi:ABC transporter permease [Aquihabitans sp. McL0605]|uniref:ABC transporter permease n=1 Tax=Aquihabitans sp. McL0605 TaxID=3415671 RepID=UPI003CF130E2
MTTVATAPTTAALPEAPSVSVGGAFLALLARDFYVLRHNLKEFIPRTVLQPLLLVFVFTYVFPKIGQGIGGSAGGSSAFSTMLVAGVLASVILFQGIQSVALPLVSEFGYTREIEDRVLAPLPVELVAVEKVVAGALQCVIAALIVFPIAYFVPAEPVHITYHWWVLLTLGPLACVAAASLGLMFGTMFDPRTVPLLFGIIVVPLTFLGCIYFPWKSLEAIRWLQIAVLANPLVYMSEGLRAALTPVPHMSLLAIFPVLLAFTAFFLWRGIEGFKHRVLA